MYHNEITLLNNRSSSSNFMLISPFSMILDIHVQLQSSMQSCPFVPQIKNDVVQVMCNFNILIFLPIPSVYLPVVMKNDELAEVIMALDNPQEIKDVGRSIPDIDAELWNHKSFEVVEAGNMAKVL